MNYQETLDFLYDRLPLFSKVGASAIKKDVDNTLRLCSFLDNPHNKFRTIHIAGTNGKGSTSHMIAAILQSAGYKTGLYTSPHLKDFRERIRINGEMIPKDEVIEFTQNIIPLIDSLHPSFFEITVAMAFDHFAKQRVDIAVIETGLGGRLDSTNIIQPEVSLITNIGWDHMQILGNTLEEIAGEKAGIIKKNIPVVIGETQPDIKHVFKNKAASLDAPLFFADQIRYVAEWKYADGYLDVWIQEKNPEAPGGSGNPGLERKNYRLDLTGVYQLKNLVGVLEGIQQLKIKGFNILEEHIKEGLSHSKKLNGLHGRWELIGDKPRVIADVAHNPDGIRQIMAQLELTDYHRLHLIIGMVKDKDVDAVLRLLPKEAFYYFTRAPIPRALDESTLMNLASNHELKGTSFPDVHSALRQARTNAGKDDLILVCGSVFLVAELL